MIFLLPQGSRCYADLTVGMEVVMYEQAEAVVLSRVRHAEDQVWAQVHHARVVDLRERDRVIAEAVTAGVPVGTLAAEIGVLPKDIDRMVSSLRE